MTDTYDGGVKNPEASEPTLFDKPEQAGSIPHSGNLGLEQPADILSTPLHEAPVHPVPDTVQEFVALKPGVKEGMEVEPSIHKTGNKWVKPAAAVLALFGAVFAGTQLGGNSDKPARVNTESGEAPFSEAAETTIPETVTPTTLEVTPKPVVKPVLMTAETGLELAEQLIHNIECAHNNQEFTEQQNCLRHIVGSGVGDLTDQYNLTISEVREYVNTKDPEFEVNIKINPHSVQARFSDQEAVLVVETTEEAGTRTKRYTFSKVWATIEQLDTEDTTVESWVLKHEDPLKPGEVSFE